MMLMSGVNSASTIVPTMTARKTIMIGSTAAGAPEEFVSGARGHNPADQNEPIILHELAHVDHEGCDRRQRFVPEHIVKDRFELRHNKNEQEAHDRHGHAHHDGRIYHRTF